MPRTDSVLVGNVFRRRAAIALSDLVSRLQNVLAALATRPRTLIAALSAIQWLLVLAFALTVRHNGWLYYQGGDQIWYTTTGSLLAHGQLPTTYVGYGWSILLAPFMRAFGPGFVAVLPAVVVLNVLVLGPLALACVHDLATRIADRLFALWASVLWVVAPFLTIPFWRHDYHERYVEQFLPQALGLTALADFPSMVLLLLAAAVFVRGLDDASWESPALAGLFAGLAVGMKPSNALFLAAPALALMLMRRPRALAVFGAAVLPSLVVLALWKQRGLGQLPLFAFEETRAAAGATLGALGVDRYVDLDWGNLQQNADELREFFWSARLLEWAPLAGAIAVWRRSAPAAALLVAWFGLFLVAKGTTPVSTVASGSFFRFLMPAYPAYFLLGAAIPLLLPRARPAIRKKVSPAPIRRGVLAAVVVTTVLLPLALIGFARPLPDVSDALLVNGILTPVDPAVRVKVATDGRARTLTWEAPGQGGTALFYRIYRTAAGGADVSCAGGPGAADCRLELLVLGTTRERRWRDGSPPPGALYRIGVAANWRDDPQGGDVFAVSPPVGEG